MLVVSSKIHSILPARPVNRYFHFFFRPFSVKPQSSSVLVCEIAVPHSCPFIRFCDIAWLFKDKELSDGAWEQVWASVAVTWLECTVSVSEIRSGPDEDFLLPPSSIAHMWSLLDDMAWKLRTEGTRALKRPIQRQSDILSAINELQKAASGNLGIKDHRNKMKTGL